MLQLPPPYKPGVNLHDGVVVTQVGLHRAGGWLMHETASTTLQVAAAATALRPAYACLVHVCHVSRIMNLCSHPCSNCPAVAPTVLPALQELRDTLADMLDHMNKGIAILPDLSDRLGKA